MGWGSCESQVLVDQQLQTILMMACCACVGVQLVMLHNHCPHFAQIVHTVIDCDQQEARSTL